MMSEVNGSIYILDMCADICLTKTTENVFKTLATSNLSIPGMIIENRWKRNENSKGNVPFLSSQCVSSVNSLLYCFHVVIFAKRTKQASTEQDYMRTRQQIASNNI